MNDTIKFGTDGWRAIIAKDYTVANVQRVAFATAQWLKKNSHAPSVVLGFDCRFGGPLFADAVIDVMLAEGVTVHFDRRFVSTPMISLACHQLQTTAGIILTASHNPPSYNGFKLKSNYGGPTTPDEIATVEALMPDGPVDVPVADQAAAEADGRLVIHDLETRYFDHVAEHFDLDAMRSSDLVLGYDAMYGAGQRILPRLLPEALTLHCDHNPGFHGQAPEPIHKNLGEFSSMLHNRKDVAFGFANDGDADRIGVYDGQGRFVDAHHVIALLIHILHKHQGMTGTVVIAFSVSKRVLALCQAYGLEVIVTKIGFKHIAGIMIEEDVLVGGEESGGIAVKGHIPERDGIWDGLVILDHLVRTGQTLDELIDEVYAVTGPWAYDRDDLHLTEPKKQEIVALCRDGAVDRLGDYTVHGVETTDGFKYDLGEERYLMIRPSGTEPVLRVYAEASDAHEVRSMLDATRAQFGIDPR